MAPSTTGDPDSVAEASSPKVPRAIVVMGVAGAGKSTVGRLLAERTGAKFIDGDDFHSVANRQKMAAGGGLTDADRWPWLDAVGAEIGRALAADLRIVVACSALRRVYRERLARAAGAELWFLHLVGSHDQLMARLRARRGHFAGPGLLDSQLATLERLSTDELGREITIESAPADVVTSVIAGFGVNQQYSS